MSIKKSFVLTSIFFLQITTYSAPPRVLFTNTDKYSVKEELLKLIASENKSIKMAIYYLTQESIMESLIEATKRKVDVELVIDRGSLGKYNISKLNSMLENKIKIGLYDYKSQPNRCNSQFFSPIMHHKYCIFESLKKLWNGSYNFTFKAENQNEENAIIYDEEYMDMINQFKENFLSLQKKCNPLEKLEEKNEVKEDKKEEPATNSDDKINTRKRSLRSASQSNFNLEANSENPSKKVELE